VLKSQVTGAVFGDTYLLTYLHTYLLTYLLTYLIHGAEYYLKKLIVTQIIKKYPPFFMEPKGSSPCSQKPATGSILGQLNPVCPIDPYLRKD
jgi:hypothetical protein